VLTQRFEIHPRPIGFRIGIEDLHNLLDRPECSWLGTRVDVTISLVNFRN
jgi:hypothetical protein